MKRNINTLVVGATYFGIGYASAHPDCLILESTQITGRDFHAAALSVDMASIKDAEKNCELGKLMKDWQILTDTGFDTLKAAPAICRYLVQRPDIAILLDTRIISISNTKDGYLVTYVSNSGISEISCRNILDTTALRESCPKGARCVSKTLNLFTKSITEDFENKLKAVCPECVIEAVTYPHEKLVKIPFSPEETLLNAHEKAGQLWQRAFPNGEEKILMISQDFEYQCVNCNDEPTFGVFIETKYPNPLTAFISGAEYAL